jgi:hypothetical protein
VIRVSCLSGRGGVNVRKEEGVSSAQRVAVETERISLEILRTATEFESRMERSGPNELLEDEPTPNPALLQSAPPIYCRPGTRFQTHFYLKVATKNRCFCVLGRMVCCEVKARAEWVPKGGLLVPGEKTS